MITMIVHHQLQNLPSATDDVLSVQIYNLEKSSRADLSTIGIPVIDKIKRLGVQVSPRSMDFLTIALAVTAADTFIHRKDAADGWTREINLKISLCEPVPWFGVKEKLEKALCFLSGDIWELDFADDGLAPPEPYTGRYELTDLNDLDCVCLFSGGLDSAIGAIDLLDAGQKPLLISHAYRGDQQFQNAITPLLSGRFSQFAVNADPHFAYGDNTEISMRTRSINFLALATVGANAVQLTNNLPKSTLLVPENGFISLNAPLTTRRIGSLSTRTTHPHFIGLIQDIFTEVGIHCQITNPYQLQTKGEMVASCRDQTILSAVFNHTVSCSHWKRSHQQCGACVPCVVRRAALKKGGLIENTPYKYDNLSIALADESSRDDIMALSIAIAQLKKNRPVGAWILDSGPLLHQDYDQFKSIFVRSLKEIEIFLQHEGVL